MEEVKRLAQENAIMAEIGRIISSTLNIEEVYERFAEEAHKLIPFDGISVCIIDYENDIVMFPYVSGVQITGRRYGDTLPLSTSVVGEVARTRSGLICKIDDRSEWKDRYPGLSKACEAGLRSFMIVPLISKDRVIGVILFRAAEPNIYSNRDLTVAGSIASQIAGAVASALLFAQHKRTEEELLKSEERFRELYDNAPVGYHEYGSDGNIIRVNRTDLEMLEYTAEEMIGHPIWKFNVNEEIVRQEVLEKLAGSRPPGRSLKRTYRRKDGTTFPVLIEDRLIRNESGSITSIRCTIQDVSEHKRAEEALKKSMEEAKRLAQENAIMAEIGRIISSTLNIEEVYERFAGEVHKLISFDAISVNSIDYEEGVVRFPYVSGVRIIGRQQGATLPFAGSVVEELARIRSGIIMEIDDSPELKSRYPALSTGYEAGLRSLMAVPLISKDQVIGAIFFRSVQSGTYSDRDLKVAQSIASQIAGAVANAQLLAERRRAEEEKRSLEEQLRQSQKLEAIGQLAGGVAHDFNNLLTVIMGYSDVILDLVQMHDTGHGAAMEIKRAAERAASLTHQLLAFSRKQMLQPKTLDLNHLISNMDKMLRRLIGEDILLTTHLSENLGKIGADPGQIEQVIMNIVLNARDAMPSGGKLAIDTANIELDGSYALSHMGVKPGRYSMISISDTGMGMPSEVKERIFEPFFTTKEKGQGTGLGLSTAYGIVKQSGGNIWVYSEPGKGTTFKIYLPWVEEEAKGIEPKVVTTKPIRGSETILLVEDEETLRRFARLFLQKSGYRLLEASDGEQALRIVQAQGDKPIHLLITDVVMPGMSGRELADSLESLRPEMKVIYMSGYTEDAVVHRGVMEEKMNFIQKPFSGEELTRKVREVLEP